MLDAHQLNIFLVAAETLNFTKAAERLRMSQPSVSQHIRSLEDHFAQALFVRQGRSLILSDAGRELIPLAEQFVRQSTRIDEAMASFKGRIKGTIKVGCSALSGRYFLPECFARFQRNYPEVTISCQTEACLIPQKNLRSGLMHFLFTNQMEAPDPCFQVENLLEEEIVLIAPLDHPFSEKDAVDPKDLLQERFILPGEETTLYQEVNAALAKENRSLLELSSFLTLSDPEAIILSVQQGLGLSFSSKIIASTFGDLALIPINGLTITLTTRLIRDKSQLTTAAQDAFWEYLTQLDEEIQGMVLSPLQAR